MGFVKNIKNLLTLFLLGLGLVGCSPTYNFTVPEFLPSRYKLNADLKDISVTYQQKEGIEPSVNIQVYNFSKEDLASYIDSAWGVALADALKRADLFDKLSAKKVSMLINVLDIQTPLFGANVTTSVSANYKIIDRATDKVIYNETLRTEATVPWNYAFLGIARANESLNQSVQQNILTFIDYLKAIKTL